MTRRLPLLCALGAMLAIGLEVRAQDGASFPGSIVTVPSTPSAAGGAFISRETLTPDEENTSLDFEVTLKMRNFAELQARLARGEQVAPAEMAAKYEPGRGDYRAVLEWLIGDGFVVTRRDSQHIAVFVRGKVGQIARALHLKFARVTLNGREFTGAVSPPRLPTGIAPIVAGINGLQPWLEKR